MRFDSLSRSTALAASLCLILGGACVRNLGGSGSNVLKLALHDDVRTLDPASAYDHVSLAVLPNIYESLYQYAYLDDPFRVVPLLAADLPTLSKDRLTVTIPLRKGVRFQDDPCFKDGKGREVTAEDFILQFKRLADPKIQSEGFWIFDGKLEGFNAFHERLKKAKTEDERENAWNAPIKGLTASDSHTLKLKLVRPYPQLIYALTMTFTAPVPKEAVTQYANVDGRIDAHPVGTGAYKLTDWDRNFRIDLERNKNFHEEFYPTEGHARFREQGLLKDAARLIPFLDGVRLEVMRENQPRWLKFVKGELDAALVPKEDFESVVTPRGELAPELASKGMKLFREPSMSIFFVLFNMKDPVLGKNKFLRQAISSAISREEWIRLFAFGRGVKANVALPLGVQDRPAGRLKYDYDLQRAKALMAKAGYPSGKGLPELTMEMRWADSTTRQLGEFFASSLAKIGITLKINLNPFPAFLQKQKQGQIQLAQGAWILDYPDPENLYQLLYGPNRSPGANHANFDHPEMNKLYAKMSTMEPGPARRAVIEKMEAILQEEVPWALGYGLTHYRVTQKHVKNYRDSELISNAFKYWKIERP